MNTAFSLPLTQYLTKAIDSYSSCLDSIGDEFAPITTNATVRFHHLKLNPISGVPMFKELAEILADQLVAFCFNAQKRNEVKHDHERQKLHREARDLLRRIEKSGEAGEILTYFLIEAILGAPQMIAKMELKTNTKLESFGADGVHVRWDDISQTLEIICAESKLEDTPSDAISNCVKSLEAFHANDASRHELRLATAHFKHANPEIKAALSRILERKEPGVNWRLRHACLVGYDSKSYSSLTGTTIATIEDEFRARYQKDRPRIMSLIQTHFGKINLPLVTFDVFILPFRTVKEFRQAFIDAV